MSAEKRILVTGAAGFIGSHTCKLLSTSGYLPIAYDNLSTGRRDAVRFGPFVQGDILDRAALDRALGEWRPEAVIHFAARASVADSFVAPDRYYRDNVVGLLNVLDAIRTAKVGKIVFSSSCATYGVPDRLPIVETCPQAPVNPYGETKLIGERLIRDYGRAFGVKYVVLRYFNASGADREGELRERHDPETHLVPRALMAAAGTISHLDVFGDDYDTPDGTCIRDYIHVEDLADGHVRALAYLDANEEPLQVNLGSGKGTSIRDILTTVEAITCRKVRVRFSPRRDGDPAALYADPAKAKSRLDFITRCSDIETIVGTAMKSFGL
jgi:UDP-arabinose 4-epimerase